MRRAEGKRSYVCIHCDAPQESLIIRKIRGGSAYRRLAMCRSCKNVADQYQSMDPVILFLDLMLFKKEAHKHVLLNWYDFDRCGLRCILMHVAIRCVNALDFLSGRSSWGVGEALYLIAADALVCLACVLALLLANACNGRSGVSAARILNTIAAGSFIAVFKMPLSVFVEQNAMASQYFQLVNFMSMLSVSLGLSLVNGTSFQTNLLLLFAVRASMGLMLHKELLVI